MMSLMAPIQNFPVVSQLGAGRQGPDLFEPGEGTFLEDNKYFGGCHFRAAFEISVI
jgi:hypothetical protein